MSDPRYPALYQINTRVWLTELSQALGKRATLDDIPAAELDRLAGMGLHLVWLLSVWQTGPAAQVISRANPQWRGEFAETLPDLEEDDIGGSGSAIQGYTVHRDLGGSTTACARDMRGRCASISTPGSISRTSWRASWKTTTSRGRLRRSRRKSTMPRRSSRFCRPGCGSFTRASSWGAGSASLPIWFADRRNRSSRGWSGSTIGRSPC